jgi:hypothetical protein
MGSGESREVDIKNFKDSLKYSVRDWKGATYSDSPWPADWRDAGPRGTGAKIRKTEGQTK